MKRRKIAITGIASGGKTVFLTALLWNLKEFKDSKFYKEVKEVVISNFSNVSLPRQQGISVLQASRRLGEGAQVAKRKLMIFIGFVASSNVAIGSCLRSQQLNFLDFPVNELLTLRLPPMPTLMIGPTTCSTASTITQTTVKRPVSFCGRLSPRTWVRMKLREPIDGCWRVSFLDYKPLISPSVFLLDEEGDKATYKSLEDLAEERICGLDEQSQFAPLPESVRKANKEVGQGDASTLPALPVKSWSSRCSVKWRIPTA